MQFIVTVNLDKLILKIPPHIEIPLEQTDRTDDK